MSIGMARKPALTAEQDRRITALGPNALTHSQGGAALSRAIELAGFSANSSRALDFAITNAEQAKAAGDAKAAAWQAKIDGENAWADANYPGGSAAWRAAGKLNKRGSFFGRVVKDVGVVDPLGAIVTKTAQGEKFNAAAKDVGRHGEVVTAKIVVPVTTVLAAAGSILLSPVVGTALSQAGGGIARVAGAGAAREEGLSGRAARDKGRKLANRTRLYSGYASIIGGGIASVAGTAINVGTTAATAMQVAGQAANVGMAVGKVVQQQEAQKRAQEKAQQQQLQITLGGIGATGAQPSQDQGAAAPADDWKKNAALIALGAVGVLAATAA